MNWFLLAIAGPFLWSLVNHADKYVLSKYIKGGGLGSLIIFSSLSAVIVLPIVYIIAPTVFDISLINKLIMIGAGILVAISILFYLYALDKDETSIVVPLFQVTPVFGYLTGYIFLGEILTKNQLIASLLILLGSLILTLEFQEDKKIKFKKKILYLMLGATFFVALYETLFKFVALEGTFLITVFWQYVGLTLAGVIIFLTVNSYRQQFFHLVKKNPYRIISFNITAEIINILGNLTTNFALLLAPVALVMTIGTFQPLFVLIGSIVLSIFFPHIAKEKISKKHLLQKFTAILIMLVGSYLVYTL